MSPVSPELAGGFLTTEPPGKVIMLDTCHYTFVKTHRMNTTKNKPKVNWNIGDKDVDSLTITCTTLVGMLIMRV